MLKFIKSKFEPKPAYAMTVDLMLNTSRELVVAEANLEAAIATRDMYKVRLVRLTEELKGVKP